MPPTPSGCGRSDAELAQLLTLLGQLRHAPADPLLRSYIPKSRGILPDARLAALWSLGQLHADTADASLVKPLTQRANDLSEMDPENPAAQAMAVLTVARDRAGRLERVVLPVDLQPAGPRRHGAGGRPSGPAAATSARTLPPLDPGTSVPRGYFLEPLD